MIRSLILVITPVALIGCNFEPSDADNRKVEVIVRDKPSPIELTRDMLNEIAAEHRESPGSDSSNAGKIAALKGRIVRVRIKSDSDDKERHGAVRLTLVHPDYEALEIECYFAAEHEAAVRGLSPGETIRVQGQVDRVFDRSIQLRGCVLIASISTSSEPE